MQQQEFSSNMIQLMRAEKPVFLFSSVKLVDSRISTMVISRKKIDLIYFLNFIIFV